jgi:hypothetical protein
LFELLARFERPAPQPRVVQQEIPPVNVQADVLPIRGSAATIAGQRRAGKIEGVAIERGDHLHNIGVGDVGGIGDALFKGRHLAARIIQ